MKKWVLSVFLFVSAGGYLEAALENGFSIVKNASLFSYTAEFLIQKEGSSLGKVVRSGLLTPRYFYDLYDTNHRLQVRGVTRAFSLGFLFAWGMEMDLYEGNYFIGSIHGQLLTTSRAKFVFCDEKGIELARAHLNDESCNFLIVSSGTGEVLTELTGKAYGDSSVWSMSQGTISLPLDERALVIFAGFIADYQQYFIRPPQREVYYYHYESDRR